MPRIGLRDLKTRASEVIRDVEENNVRYTVTNRGTPVALLVPYTVAEERRPMTAEESTAYLDGLAKKITEAWTDPRSVADLMDEIRR